MKKRLAIILVLPLLALAACPDNDVAVDDRDRAVDTQELDQVRERIQQAVVRGDPQGIADLFTDDAFYSPASGERLTSRDEIRRDAEQAPPITEFTLNAQHVDGHGDTAWEYGQWTQTMEGQDGETVSLSGNYMIAYERDRNGPVTGADPAATDDDAATQPAPADRNGRWRVRAAVANMPPEQMEQMEQMQQVQPDAAAPPRAPGEGEAERDAREPEQQIEAQDPEIIEQQEEPEPPVDG